MLVLPLAVVSRISGGETVTVSSGSLACLQAFADRLWSSSNLREHVMRLSARIPSVWVTALPLACDNV